MKTWSGRFNIYLLALAAALSTGCKTHPPADGKKEEAKDDKKMNVLWFHLEENPDSSGRNGPVPIYRANPEWVTVSRSPFLSEEEIEKIKVLDAPGGIEIEVQFSERTGKRLLEMITTANLGRRIAVLGQFDHERRWLAAPKITRRLAEGLFRFTPDATREETEKLVQAINQQIRKAKENKSTLDSEWR